MLNPRLSTDGATKNLVSTERKALMSTVLSLNNSVDEGQIVSNRTEPIIVRMKRNAASETMAIDMQKYQNSTMDEFKRKHFLKEYEENMSIRFIYEGKQLKEEDKIMNIKFKHDTYLHVFISKPIQQENNITVISAEAYDNEKRGFDKLRPFDVMEEELTLFRGKFHCKNILLLKNEQITEQVLFEYEEEWVRENIASITSPEKARQVIQEYDSGFPEVRGGMLDFFAGLVAGLILNILAIFFIYIKSPSTRFRRGTYTGLFITLAILFVIRYFVFRSV